MSEELRPCPFCGEDDDITANLRDGWFYVSCNKCGALTHMFYRRKSEAIKAWNTRPIEDALNARIAELEAENALLKQDPQPIELWSDEKKQIYKENERRTVKTGREVEE